jgi:hypothetical protein
METALSESKSDLIHLSNHHTFRGKDYGVFVLRELASRSADGCSRDGEVRSADSSP